MSHKRPVKPQPSEPLATRLRAVLNIGEHRGYGPDDRVLHWTGRGPDRTEIVAELTLVDVERLLDLVRLNP